MTTRCSAEQIQPDQIIPAGKRKTSLLVTWPQLRENRGFQASSGRARTPNRAWVGVFLCPTSVTP